MTVVFGITCIHGADSWELEEIYVSYARALERVEKLEKRYPDERFFVTSKNLIE